MPSPMFFFFENYCLQLDKVIIKYTTDDHIVVDIESPKKNN